MKIKLKKSKKENPDIKGGDMRGSKISLKNISRKKLLVCIALVVLVILSAGWLLFMKNQKNENEVKVELKSGSQLSGQVETLSNDQAKEVVSRDASSTDEKYAKALALSKLGKHNEALTEFKAIANSGKGKYYIYNDYALTAARTGNVNLAIELLETAIQKLQNDSSVDQYVKAAELKTLNNKLAGFKDEAGQ